MSSPEMEDAVHTLLPPAKVVSVKSFYDLPPFADFDAALWTEAQAVALAGTRKGITAVRPADFGNPFLFTYIMPGNSREFLR